MKNILVTGGAGFIGSNFVRYILGREFPVKVINLDALTYAGSLENLKDLPNTARYTFINGNICDRGLVESLFNKFAIDTVVHFAAETHVDRSIVDAYPFIQTNVVGTFILLDVARQRWIQSSNLAFERARFHHISTDEVYGSLKLDEPPFSEDHPYQPNSPYASSKAASDHLVRAYAHTYGVPVSITNCSNNYGPFQFPEKLIPLTILNALEGKPIPLYGDGNQIRDWLYAEDHCNAIWQVLEKGRVGETYNIGGNNQITNLELVRQICRILDEEFPNSPYRPHESLIAFVQDRPGHDYRYAMDNTKISSEVGWQPEETLSSGLRRTVEWYLSQQEWVLEIQKRSSYREWIEENYAFRGEVL